MPEPLRDKAQILADPEAFKAAFEKARKAFEGKPGVVGVTYGLRQKAGVFGEEFAIVILVDEKKAPGLVPADQMIPPTFEGYATDVRVVPRATAHACDNSAKYATIQGGIQITNQGEQISPNQISLGAGTIACIVRRCNDISRDNVYILSNNHVLCGHGHGADDYIYHPEYLDPDAVSLGPIQAGGTENDIPFTPAGAGAPQDFFVDCAIARLDIDSKCCGSTCTKDTLAYTAAIIDLVQVTPTNAGTGAPQNAANMVADVRNVIGDLSIIGDVVTKVGRTTGKTQGRVTATVTTFQSIDRQTHVVKYTGHNVIEIDFDVNQTNCKGHAFFSEEGDSGSLIVDAQNRAIGLLSQGAPDGSPPGTTSIACHIVPVLDHLGICIDCASAGTSHGSSHAEDGSGVAPSPLPPDGSAIAAGPIVFAEQRPRAAAPPTAPPPLTGPEIDHMQAMLAAFRATPQGPALHAAFGEVRREVGYLVRNCRPVTVAWHRNQGPAFLTLILNHLAGHADFIPHIVKGVSRRDLLSRMRDVLMRFGSNPLRAALTQHGDLLLAVLTAPNIDSIHDCLSAMREHEKEPT
jgi:hypothetical protein